MTDFNKQDGRRRTKLSATTTNYLEQGKLPPQAVDLEEAILGAMMLEKDATTKVIDRLHPAAFYKESHQKIFECIKDLFGRNEPIDILTVAQELKKRGDLEIIGGAYYITQLTNRIASAANIEAHSLVVVQKYLLRELISISTETIKDAYDDSTDVFDLMDKLGAKLFELSEKNLKKNYAGIESLIRESMTQITQIRQNDSGLIGVGSGFTDLDRITSGWQNSDLIIVAARPAMGKTSYVLSLARNAAVMFKKPVAIFSLEMSSVQLVTRLISAESEISIERLRNGNLRQDEIAQINHKIRELENAKIFIDDTAGLSIFDLRAKARRLKSQHNIQMIVIDYLQLMSSGTESRGNRVEEISLISRSLKSIAKELNIPVIALSQLSRAVESRGGDKKPQLSDLRESGSIEQDADMVQFIHRPEYYNLTVDANGQSTKNVANIIIAKHRNGAVCDIKLKFINELAKFEDFDLNYQGDNSSNMGFSNMPIGSNFDEEQGTIIKQSKLNETDDDFSSMPPMSGDAPY
ncbi:MAG: replicative DNA helicase [Flavobacteriales bacterium]|nr:replicative DNA helicase [Flavobacteriales bacterium]